MKGPRRCGCGAPMLAEARRVLPPGFLSENARQLNEGIEIDAYGNPKVPGSIELWWVCPGCDKEEMQ